MREFPICGGTTALDTVVDQAIAGEDVVITRDGRKEAVVVAWATWQRLSQVPSFGRLLASSPLEEGDIPSRDRSSGRDTGL